MLQFYTQGHSATLEFPMTVLLKQERAVLRTTLKLFSVTHDVSLMILSISYRFLCVCIYFQSNTDYKKDLMSRKLFSNTMEFHECYSKTTTCFDILLLFF